MNAFLLWIAQGFGVGRIPFAPGTFGSVLGTFHDRLFAVLRAHEDDYAAVLKTHFDKHIAPFQD